MNHNVNGQEITWNNPLISTIQHAKDLEEWIAEYYLGNIDYEISWRGDPRTEANDLFYMELKGREDALIRSYQNEISFNGAWSGNMKARKVEMSWRLDKTKNKLGVYRQNEFRRLQPNKKQYPIFKRKSK